LALAALAIQFLLTFSHIDIDCWSSGGAGTALSAVTDGGGATVPHKTPPTHKSDRTADQTCPICALIQLAATSSPAAAPVLTTPTLFVVGRLEAPAIPAPPARHTNLFRARAPPIA
jgi:hypothetical protein